MYTCRVSFLGAGSKIKTRLKGTPALISQPVFQPSQRHCLCSAATSQDFPVSGLTYLTVQCRRAARNNACYLGHAKHHYDDDDDE